MTLFRWKASNGKGGLQVKICRIATALLYNKKTLRVGIFKATCNVGIVQEDNEVALLAAIAEVV